MKPGLAIGHVSEFSIQVTPAMQPQFGDTVIHPLYSTAAMINHMEWAARQHILPYLEPGEEGAGYHIDLKHLAATPVGATVTVRSTVKKVTPKRVISVVEAWHNGQKIGEGLLTQAIVPLQKLYATLSASEEEESPETQNPPPAVLRSTDGQQTLTMEVLRWETGSLPCTRYDEWLVCRVQAEGRAPLEGPFLLRYEIEEWITALEGLLQGKSASYQSDFLESMLKLRIEARGSNTWRFISHCQHPVISTTPPVSIEMDVDTSALQQFTAQLHDQMEGFPSLL